MPIEPIGSGTTQSGDSPQSWTPIPCPGFCPVWPCEYIYLNLPAMEYYVPPDPVARTFPYSGWILLSEGYPVYGNFPTCGGKAWGGLLTTEAGIGQEGFRSMEIAVCCKQEHLNYPVVHFNFYDSIRETGDPDPGISICVRNICLSNISCRCTAYPDHNLPGYNHGVASAPKFNEESTCSDLTINDQNATTSLEVRCLCNGSCDCYGIPTSLNVSVQCDSGSGYEEVGSGTMDFVASSANADYPHWEGEVVMDVSLGGCTVNAYLICNSNPPDSYGITFAQPSCGFPCACYDLITALGSAEPGVGQCDPFSATIDFSGWLGCFTGGGGAGPRIVVSAP